MKKINYIALGMSTLGFTMILVAMIMLNGGSISSIKMSDSLLVFNESNKQKETAQNTVIDNINASKMSTSIDTKRNVASAEVLRVEVFEGLTLEELTNKLNKNLGKAVLAGKGELIASYSLSKGVDPYIATAIMVHETGYGTSRMVRECNNVAGQKGFPNCMGAYKGYDSIDDGIRGAIDNLAKNYFSMGLTTPETIGPKYAESTTWPAKVSSFVNKIRNS